ncbi:MAG: nitroreductase [Clostridia bacterium]|nr:nitroreductase [Clostridia bacterium]
MNLNEAIIARHSVRKYQDKPIEAEAAENLQEFIKDKAEKSGIKITLQLNEPEAFGSGMATYGKFENCKNYITFVGKKEDEEKCGYYGEQIVLHAQQLGLNTCWVALTYNKSKIVYDAEKGEKLLIVIALGYGQTQGHPRATKPMQELCKIKGDETPDWFKKAMEAVMLAPTAINQQKFVFYLDGNNVEAKTLLGFYAKIDLGIAKLHFEIGAGDAPFNWV